MAIGLISFKCMIDLEIIENLYFDLDLVIYDKLPDLIRKDFTLLDDTWFR